MPPVVDPVTSWAQLVVDGKVLAGPHVRAACRRHLDDLVHGPDRGLVWDPVAAQFAIDFFPEVLCLNGGEHEGVPFHLLGWQQFVVGCLFGWLGPDGLRRFRVAYVETGKGSGKSPLAAGIGMFGLVADGEARAEVYAAASKKDQAMVLFRDAVVMWRYSPELLSRLTPSGSGENVWNLAYRGKGSFFRPIAMEDGQSGPRPHMGLVDEVHEHKTNAVVEMLRAGTKNRRQALIFMITNSGAGRTSPCRTYHEYGVAVCEGLKIDDSFFAFICALDEGDDPMTDEGCWPKANPSLLEANLPGMKYLREQVTEARGMPSKEATVRRLSFCQWTGAVSPWLSADVWLKAGREFDWKTLKGRRVWAGLDLSSTTDLTAFVMAIEPRPGGFVLDEKGQRLPEPWYLVPFCWLPEEGLARKAEIDGVPYLQWLDEGFLETTPGRAVSKLHVLKRVMSILSDFELQKLCYDRWRIEDLISLAKDNDIELPPKLDSDEHDGEGPCLVGFGQGHRDMSPAVEEFETQLLNGVLVHANHPVLTWCASNAVTVEDDAGNRKPSKKKATGRIDLITASLMAVGGAMRTEEPEEDDSPPRAIVLDLHA